jgi:hypothetical protein
MAMGTDLVGHTAPLRRLLALVAWVCSIAALVLGPGGAPALAAAPAPATVPEPEALHEYVIQPGDNLWSLGREYFSPGRDWRDVQRYNKVRDPRRMRPGSVVRIPVAWLRTAPAQAEVQSIQGDVRLDRAGVPVAVERGTKVVAGDVITTAAGGYATLRFDDGATVVVQAGTRAEVSVLRTRPLARAGDTAVGIERGAVDSKVPRRGPGDRFEIRTPLAATAVRGTEFRAGYDEQARVSRTEVLEGRVEVARPGAGGSNAPVAAGFGAAVEATGAPRVVRLLPAPDLTSIADRHERTILRLPFPAVPGASAYRAMVFEQDGDRVVFNSVTERPEVRIADVPDGRYRMRVRAIDAARLEGLDAERTFVLKARPEPPFPSAPVDGARVRADAAQLSWTGAQEAVRYRIQLADNPQFRTPLVDRTDVTALAFTTPALADGTWYWRLASIRADGDTGPFSDPSRFERRPPPAEPEPPAMDESRLNLRWRGEPGQVFRLQLARDDAFAAVVLEQTGLTTAQASLERPAPGVYFLRVQATDPDGFVGPYTTPQRVVVPEPPPSTPWWPFLLLLLPFL